MHVGDQHRAPLGGGGTANAPAERDAHAGGPALEWPDEEIPAGSIEQVEPNPVEIRQTVVDERSRVRGATDEIRFAGQERLEAAGELGVVRVSAFRHLEVLLVHRMPSVRLVPRETLLPRRCAARRLRS